MASSDGAESRKETLHWKDQEKCQGCGAQKSKIGQEGGEPLRAIKLRDGGRDLLCSECFVEALNDGRVSEDDPRVASDGRPNLGTPAKRGVRD